MDKTSTTHILQEFLVVDALVLKEVQIESPFEVWLKK
jgi:hypothetical protein